MGPPPPRDGEAATITAVLQVTPTGPWGKDVHPNLPVSMDELLTDLRRCFQAGATGVHLHVRDRSGAETLEPAVVDATCVAVRRIDVGMWAPVEIDRLLGSGLLPRVWRVSIELDPGEPYFLRGAPAELAQRVNDLLDEAGSTCPRLTHGMNAWTWPLVEDAFRRGHDTRVGFEDSVLLPDGTTAESNAQLVEAALALR